MHRRIAGLTRTQRIILWLTIIALQSALTARTEATGQSSQMKDGSQTSQTDVRKLEKGKQIERELRGGETHSYEITLQSGQFLQVVVDQRGIDVVVQVIGPDGKQVMEIDSPNGRQGDEPVMLTTEAAGVYRFNVSSLEKNAPVGKYEIQVKELRAANERDRALIEKDHMLQEATKLNQQVERLYGIGKYDMALPLAERALAIRKEALGEGHPSTAESLNNLAELQSARGDSAKAELLHLSALAIREKALGPEHPSTATSYANLGALYHSKGDYSKAEPYFIRDLEINEKIFGAADPLTASSLNNLAVMYESKGDYAKAEALCIRALTIRKEALGPLHPLTADSLNNLAGLYRHIGDYAKAERMYTLALTIHEHNYGPEHRSTGASLSNLAFLYYSRGEYAVAEPLFIRALEIYEKLLGPEHPDTSSLLDSLAGLHYSTGDYVKAEPLYMRSLAIRERALGTEHPSTANSLYNLAVLEESKGDFAKAIDFQSRCNEVSDRDLIRNLASGSERQKLVYLSRTSLYADSTISLHIQSAPDDMNAKHAALLVLLQRKGRGLDALTDAMATLRRRLSPKDQELLKQFVDVRSQLSVLTLRGPGGEGLENHRANLEALEEQEEKLQTDISQRSAEFRAQSQTQSRPVTIGQLQKAIPHGAALIEFAQYHPSDPKVTKPEKRYGKPRYVAYVLPSQGESGWAELGDAQSINKKIDSLRKALRDKRRTDVKRLARAVDRDVMQPVRKLLGKTRRLFLSPDSALNLIPFAALVDERGEYLVKRYHFTYLTSGRDLLRLQEKVPSKQRGMILADPDFGEKPENAALSGESNQADLYFGRLKGTEEEARQMRAIFPDAQTLTRNEATEAALKGASSPELLHIATHGFFLDELAQVQSGDKNEQTRIVKIKRAGAGFTDETDAAKLINPLMRSGLGLAGANTGNGGDRNDGILTAFEAAGLDLWGTKLVVLSACDTGVGEVKNGDGVYGLRRALVLAGSESQVMSLWPVSDSGTRELMIEYYRRLKAGEGRSEALRQAQLTMVKDPRRRHPFYWASFIQSGEWANLDGKR